MNNSAAQHTLPGICLWLIVLIGLTSLAWYGILDSYSSEVLNTSIASWGSIYGSARGINALVSLLQSTEINIPFLTFTIGEVLDPVNDLIERFSDVVLIALGSLALQKILLVIVSDTLFNILLTIIAVATGIGLFLGSAQIQSALLRTFLVIAFLRYSLGLVVVANSWVDATFLDEADQQRHAAMERFQGELREIDTLTQKEREATQALADLETTEAPLARRLDEGQLKLHVLDTQIEEITKNIERLSNEAGGLCRLSDISPTCPEGVRIAKEALETLEDERSELSDRVDVLEDSLEKLRKQRECLEKRQQGGSCSFWVSLPEVPDIDVLRQKLEKIDASLGHFAENCIDLLVSLLLKTVAIPLLFIYLLFNYY